MHDHATLLHGVPDCCADSPDNVAAGETRTIKAPTEVIDCLGVHGTLIVSSQLNVETLLVYDDGELTLTPGAEIVIADRPIDVTHDPEQWSHGILNFGKTRAAGSFVTPFVRLAQEVSAGQTTLLLGAAVTGWSAGQRLVLPDTRQSRTDSQSEVVTIEAIDLQTVTITPAQFDHKAARLPDGSIKFLPHAANLSRDIVIRSENPTGTRGHIASLGRADFDWSGVEIRDMGRTTAELLDSTTFDVDGNVTHLGTNQIGRYALHFHHNIGPTQPQMNGGQFSAVNLSVHGNRKWGIAVHDSHWGLIDSSVIYDGQGAGLVTEDGSETGNIFQHNFIAKCVNWGAPEITDGTDPDMRRGSGIVLRSPATVLRGNVVADTREAYNYLTEAQEGTGPTSGSWFARVPKAQGLDPHDDANVTVMKILDRPRAECDDNEAYASTKFGLGLWVSGAVPEPPITNTRIWHTEHVNRGGGGPSAIIGKYTDFDLRGLTLLNEGGQGVGLAQFNPAFSLKGDRPNNPSIVDDFDIRGFESAWRKAGQLGQARFWEWRDGVSQNVVGFPINNFGQGNSASPDPTVLWHHVKHLPMPGLPLRSIETTFEGFELLPRRFHLTVEAHQGNPDDNFTIHFLQPSDEPPTPAPCTTTRPDIVGFVCGGVVVDPPPIDPPPPPPIDPPPPVEPATVSITLTHALTLELGTYVLQRVTT